MTPVVDVLLVICFLLTMAAGIRSGFFREGFAILGVAAGLIAGLGLTSLVLFHLPTWMRGSRAAPAMVFTALFIVAYGILGLVGRAFASLWEGKEPGGLSRFFGLILGGVRGYLLVLILVVAIVLLSAPGSPALARSRVIPYLGYGITTGAQLLPPDLRATILRRWAELHFVKSRSSAPVRPEDAPSGGPTTI